MIDSRQIMVGLKSTLSRHIILGLICIGALAVAELITFKQQGSIYVGYALKACLGVFFIKSLLICREHFSKMRNTYLRYFSLLIFSALLTCLFGYIAFIVVVNIHLALRGNL